MLRRMEPGKAARALVLAALVAACGGGATSTTPTTSAVATAPPATSTVASEQPTPAPDLAHPVGVIAIGHSALTGEGTAGASQPNLEASWATGTTSSVNSIATRLIQALPDTAGHVSNKAKGGAPARELLTQAKAAMREVPVPLLAIIDTIDNDIRCDAATVAQVGKSINEALAYIHDASPNTKILVVDQPGRPSVDFVKRIVAAHPEMKATAFTWNDECSFYDASGKLDEAAFEKLTVAIDAYEAEQSRVCKLVPNCFDDGGVRRAYIDTLETYSPDFAHFNVRGQTTQAALLWPVVQGILGL